MVLWNGACIVHEIFSLKKITELKEQDIRMQNLLPILNVKNPYCGMADFIGSTTALLKYTQTRSVEGVYCGNRIRHPASDEKIIAG